MKDKKTSTHRVLTHLKKVRYLLEKVCVLATPMSGRLDKTSILHAFDTYSDQFSRAILNLGRVEAVKRYKEYHHIATLIAMGADFAPLPFTKSRKGVPLVLRPVLSLIKGNKWEIRFGLTITRMYTLVRVKPVLDTSPITESGINIPDSLLQDWKSHVSAVLQKCPLPECEIDFSFGVRTGPNGPAVPTSHYDGFALKQTPLYDVWMKLANKIYHPLRSSLEHCLSYPLGIDATNLHIGKIALIPEKGGKTRTIAIVDFWTQQLLKPFHRQLLGLLSTLFGECDSTYDQDKAFKRAMSHSKGRKTYSFDLKSATDRFPFLLQRVVLNTLYGEQVGGWIASLMVDRDFYVKELGKSVRWNCGQPLGCYASWPLFTLTHHVLVRHAAALVKVPQFNQYQILGDDIVIWDEPVALSYESLLSQWGIPINTTKSIVSDNSNSYGEFAKRLFLNGEELSPLSPHMLSSASRSLYDFPALIQHLTDRWQLPEVPTELCSLEFFPKGRHLLSVLYGFKHLLRGEISFPWCLIDLDVASLIKGVSSYFQKTQIASLFVRSGRLKAINPSEKAGQASNLAPILQPEFRKLGIVVSDSLLRMPRDDNSEDPHPILLAQIARSDYAKKVTGSRDEPNDSQYEDYTEPAFDSVISLIKQSRRPITHNLDNFFYEDNRRLIAKTAIECYFSLLSKRN